MKGGRQLFELTSGLGERSSDFRTKSVIKLIRLYLRRGSILDIGCGSGHLMHSLKKDGFEVHGIEPSATIIKEGRKLFGSLDIKNGLAENSPRLFKTKFDNITMLDVLEHIRDDRLVLRNCYRSLKDGGRIVVFVPAYNSLFSKRDVAYGHYRRYGKAELRAKMEKAGFEVLRLRFWNALMLPVYFAYSKLPYDMESRYIAMRQKDAAYGKLFERWLTGVENRLSFGFGVNILCVGEKHEKRAIKSTVSS